MKKILLAVLALVGCFALFRWRKSTEDERTLWHEATTAPDLR